MPTRTEFATYPYLGRFIEDHRAYGNIRYRGPKHLLSFGPPGSSKTVGLIIPSTKLLRSQFIIDVKAQIAAITARQRAKMGRVIVINPMQLFVKQRPDLKDHGYNCLAQLNPKSLSYATNAWAIANILIQDSGSGKDKFFVSGARSIFAMTIMHLRRTLGPGVTLPDVRRVLMAPTMFSDFGPVSGFQHSLLEMACSDYPPIANLAGRFTERLSDKSSMNTSLQDVLDTCITETNWIDDPLMAKCLSGKSIDFAKMRKEITTVYVILPIKELRQFAGFLRLVVAQALERLYDPTPIGEADTLPPVLFILDEMAAIGRVEAIETAQGIARDSRIQIWPFLQDISQLKDLYPKRWQTFFTGAGAITSFSPKDWDTAEFFAKYAGQKSESNVTISSKLGGEFGTGESQQGYPLFRPEELRAMQPNTMLCFVEPEPNPFFTLVPPYPDTPFGEGLDPNPYYQPPRAAR